MALSNTAFPLYGCFIVMMFHWFHCTSYFWVNRLKRSENLESQYDFDIFRCFPDKSVDNDNTDEITPATQDQSAAGQGGQDQEKEQAEGGEGSPMPPTAPNPSTRVTCPLCQEPFSDYAVLENHALQVSYTNTNWTI